MEAARRFESIVIIFNPNSTGDAPRLAEQLKDRLAELLPYPADVRLQPTEHAGHAVDLARQAAAAGGDRVLVVSVSGDGGYNEVVNGVMQSGNRDAVCAVMAAGNANDHRRTVGTKPWRRPSPRARYATSTCCGSTRVPRKKAAAPMRTRISASASPPWSRPSWKRATRAH